MGVDFGSEIAICPGVKNNTIIEINREKMTNMVVANAGLWILAPKPAFKAAIMGMPTPARIITIA